ncbi:MAG: hypothetical protein ACO3EZ_08630 [Prochlorotrichaceae cyanobacterium]
MKKTLWQQAITLPQTYALIVATLIGFGGLVGMTGDRTIVWVGGSSISIAMLGSWVWGFRSPPVSPTEQNSQDWLQRETLLNYLEQLEQSLPAAQDATWRAVKIWVLEAQASARRIVEQEPLLHVDILETLHTVIGLTTQVAEALTVQANIQTPAYRTVAHQHLQVSCDRLKDSNEQLKQLQDQLMLSKLERSVQGTQSQLPRSLQTLIAANKLILEQNHESNAS